MAASKNFKKKVGTVKLPECPVCLEALTVPIFQCKSGHSLCKNCTTRLYPPLCPVCRQNMTTMRNFALEEMIAKVKTPSPNKPLGCNNKSSAIKMNDNVKKSVHREMDSPMGIPGSSCRGAARKTQHPPGNSKSKPFTSKVEVCEPTKNRRVQPVCYQVNQTFIGAPQKPAQNERISFSHNGIKIVYTSTYKKN